jgi:hypothetical protein
MSMPRIVGINGFRRAGKDTIGQFLVDEYGYHRLSFAEPLYEAVYRLNPWMRTPSTGPWTSLRAVRLRGLVDDNGWEALKGDPGWGDEIRRLLQYMGTEVGREMFGQDFWVDLALSKTNHTDRYVFTDARFENEFAAINEYKPDSFMLKVTRPGLISDGHASETEWPDEMFDGVVHNDGTVTELFRQVGAKLRVGML